MGKTEQELGGFGGFDAMFSTLGHEVNPDQAKDLSSEGTQVDDDNQEPVDLSLGKKNIANNDVSNPDDLERTSDEGDDNDVKEINELDTKPEGRSTRSKKEEVAEDESDHQNVEVDENESNQIGVFFDAFAEQLGWDVDDDEKPNSIEGLIDYMKNIVEENSKPSYASEDVKNLDEFVRNGGSISDYYNSINNIVDYDTIDLEDESNQKRVIKEFLKYTGASDALITKKINKYEDAGLLEDEAEEALEYLKDAKAKEHQELLKQQETQAVQIREQQQNFYKSVVNEIENLKDIRGISVPKEDKKKLLDYLFKVDAEGKSQYAKDYSKQDKMARNLIESAYFTMNGDTLINKARRTGETSAVAKLKETLTSKKINGSKHNEGDQATPVWQLGSFLQKPNN